MDNKSRLLVPQIVSLFHQHLMKPVFLEVIITFNQTLRYPRAAVSKWRPAGQLRPAACCWRPAHGQLVYYRLAARQSAIVEHRWPATSRPICSRSYFVMSTDHLIIVKLQSKFSQSSERLKALV